MFDEKEAFLKVLRERDVKAIYKSFKEQSRRLQGYPPSSPNEIEEKNMQALLNHNMCLNLRCYYG